MNSSKQMLLLVFIVSVLINSLIFIVQWYALSPFGNSAYLQFVSTLIVLATMAMLFIPILAFGLALPYKRKRTLLILACCAVYAGAGFLFAKLSMLYREYAFEKLAERSQPLVSAIERFEKERGYPPENLRGLVPAYLRAIPATGIGSYPDYTYEVNAGADPRFTHRWILYVSIPKSGVDKAIEKFIYLPDPVDREDWHGKVIWRMGNWEYISEPILSIDAVGEKSAARN